MNKKPSIQEVKEFWDKRPCNIRHSNKQIGTKEYFDEVENKKFFVEPHILSFTDFPKWRDKSVLEIGCGIGTAAVNFAKNGANYTAVELSSESMMLTKKRFDLYNLNGEFYCENAENLSSIFQNKKFDLIYSFGVIHHSPNPRKIIEEIKNVMHSDSVLKIMIYAKNSWKNIMIEAGLDQPEAQYGCPIAYTYTRDEARELLNGFEICSIEQDHIFPYQVEQYKLGKYVKNQWFETMPEKMFKILEKKLGWHLLITAKLEKGEV